MLVVARVGGRGSHVGRIGGVTVSGESGERGREEGERGWRPTEDGVVEAIPKFGLYS